MRRRPIDQSAGANQCEVAKHLTTVGEGSQRYNWHNVVALGIKQSPERSRNALHHRCIKVIGLRPEAQVLSLTKGNMWMRQCKAHSAPIGFRERLPAETA